MSTVFFDRTMSDKIKQYWNERARHMGGSTQATTDDLFLRELEIAKLKEKISAISLPHGSAVVDLGCGDGYSTLSIAAAFPTVRFVGIDYSEEMLALAEERRLAEPELLERVSFQLGDMRRLSTSVKADRFEVILSMRSLINLSSCNEQYDVLRQIGEHLKPGGYYFGSENFLQGQKNFNRLRTAMGLPEIPIRWHNHFFDEEEFLAETEKYFDGVIIENFSSSYYLATRVIYSAGCQLRGEQPDYYHPIHRIAGKLPVIGDFSPIKLVSMRRKL